MGATVSRTLSEALNKWVYASTEPISAEKMLKESLKAARTVRGNNFVEVVKQVCEQNGVLPPASSVIANYQTAVGYLASCINGFTKEEMDQLKTALGKVVSKKRIAFSEQFSCAGAISRVMHWGRFGDPTKVARNLKTHIVDPMDALLQTLGQPNSREGLPFSQGELVYPALTAAYIYHMMLGV